MLGLQIVRDEAERDGETSESDEAEIVNSVNVGWMVVVQSEPARRRSQRSPSLGTIITALRDLAAIMMRRTIPPQQRLAKHKATQDEGRE